MAHALWENSSLMHNSSREESANAISLISAIHEHGLLVRPNPDGTFQLASDIDSAVGSLGGAETDHNLRTLQNWLNAMRNASLYIERAAFRSAILPHVQEGNRSVESALRNMQSGVGHMLNFMLQFMGKDVKHPLRFLMYSSATTDYGQDPNLVYTDEETGTYHTLQALGENQAWATWSTYLEDTPTVRRYIRYVDAIARRSGMRVVYCPKEFNHLEELSTPARPTWARHGAEMVRQVQSDRYKLLYVSLAFDYNVFRDLTVIETEAQPGQRYRQASSMDYSPIFVDNLDGIAKVITTLGSFAACKIYYKDFRNSTRSSQADPSS